MVPLSFPQQYIHRGIDQLSPRRRWILSDSISSPFDSDEDLDFGVPVNASDILALVTPSGSIFISHCQEGLVFFTLKQYLYPQKEADEAYKYGCSYGWLIWFSLLSMSRWRP